MFIDLHSHILPYVDDGAENFEASLELILQAVKSGTTAIAATPHYNHPFQCAHDNSKERIIEVYKQLKSIVAQNKIEINLFLGAELLASEELRGLYKSNELITINSSRYILSEFYFDENPKVIQSRADELLSYGLIPVIAHPERYAFLTQSFDDLYQLVNKGCVFQINKGSPLGKYGEGAKNASQWLLKNGFASLISSDCHSPDYRNSDMGEIYNWLINEFSETTVNKLMHDNAKCILLDKNI